MVRKSVYEEVGDFRFDRSGDWDMWLRIAKKHPIAFIRERLYQYRRHGANMSLDRRTLEATEQQDKIILDGILSDESVGSRTKPMRQQAYAAYFSRKARLRLLQADWRAGWWAYRDSLAWNARLALGPRNIGRLMVALAYGVLHGPKARS